MENKRINSSHSSSLFHDFLQGVKQSLPIVLGYFSVAISYGVIALQTGISLWHTLSMSLLIYAGASQFMAVSMIGLGASAMELVLATLVLNFRYFVLSFSLMSRLTTISQRWKAILSYWLTDETFTVSALKADETEESPSEENGAKKGLSHAYLAGLFITPYLFWNLGTLSGALLSTFIPPSIGDSMTIALYAMFIGLLVPALGKGWGIAAIALAGALICSALVLLLDINSGWGIVLATCLASIPGIFLFKEEE